jgi:galactokinase
LSKLFDDDSLKVRKASVMVTIEALKQLNDPQITKATLAEMSKRFDDEFISVRQASAMGMIEIVKQL